MSDPNYEELYRKGLTENERLTQLLEQMQKQLTDALSGNAELLQQMKKLQEKLDIVLLQLGKKNRKDFGKKTERNPRPAITVTPSASTRPKKRRKPTPLPTTANAAEPQKVSHAFTTELVLCPHCLVDTKKIGEDLSYQLERFNGSIKQLMHAQEVRSCPKCKEYLVTAEKPPLPIPGGYAGPGLLAWIIVSKFLDGLPLYRLQKIIARDGHLVPSSTLSDWVLATSVNVEPLYDVMKRELLKSKIIKTDDTESKFQDRKSVKKMRKGKQTVYIGDAMHPYILFDSSPDKSFTNNIAFLKDFRGFVQADAANGFDALFKDGSKTEIGCAAHSRRGYFDAAPLHKDPVLNILDIYGKLYDVEAEAADKSAAVRLALRRRKSKPLVKQLRYILIRLQQTLTPKNPLRLATNYTLKHWLALTKFLKDGDINIDNNTAERAIKDFVICRKNFLFSGSEAAAKAAAIHLSLVASAKRNNIDPLAYLADIFNRINSVKTSELEQFLPDRWTLPVPQASDSSSSMPGHPP